MADGVCSNRSTGAPLAEAVSVRHVKASSVWDAITWPLAVKELQALQLSSASASFWISAMAALASVVV